MSNILTSLGVQALATLQDPFVTDHATEVLESSGTDSALYTMLTRWCEANPLPLVLLVDEIDSLIGDTLVSVLRQLRSGYDMRPALFPQSVILCGVRDVRDYRIHASSGKEPVTGGSTFNIKAASLRLGNFCEREVRALLAQHTEETDQVFQESAILRIVESTGGQPWLVNALAYETCFEDKAGRARDRQVTAEAVDAARETLILRRETHLDQLADKLATARQLSPYSSTSSLGAVLGLGKIKGNEVLNMLDWLLKRQPWIERGLARRYLQQGTLILYDMTSSYLEGRCCPLARFGYNRDRKRGKKQIAIGLLCNSDEMPTGARWKSTSISW